MRMKEFVAKAIMAEKKVSQKTLGQYNALELQNNMGCVEMAMFPGKFNENLVKDFYDNLTVDIDKDII